MRNAALQRPVLAFLAAALRHTRYCKNRKEIS
jgi:hypothetical protein